MTQDSLRAYRYTISTLAGRDPRSAGFLADAHSLDFQSIESIEAQDLYFIEGDLTPAELDRLGDALFIDPVTQSGTWREVKGGARSNGSNGKGCLVVEVALRAGVTDPVAEQIVRAAHVIAIQGVKRASTGLRFLINWPAAKPGELDLLAKRLLSNPVIQRYELGEVSPSFPVESAISGQVDTLKVRGLSDEQLLALSAERRAALDLAEMKAIQAYCERESRDLTDVEFEMIAQTWSEHCVHKSFKAEVSIRNYAELPPDLQEKYPGGKVDNLMRAFLKAATDQIAAPWVRSAFVDNAGIVDFDGKNEISFKVETHNHPSAIEPFGGANTGVGGVIRDVLGVSAKPIAATDVLCFGPQRLPFEQLPEGVLHPRRIMSGVVSGVQDYGNKIGIPTVNGAVVFDPGFTSNPLVYCGCVGIAPIGSHPRGAQPGDRVIVIGGRTGRDGLRGATFSSMTMDAQTGEVSGASVQIGAPITEKGLIDVIVLIRDEKRYHAVTDCGAGGLSSAVGEMASELGGVVMLDDVRLKYPGLQPWEIWLSEAQERMVLAVPPEHTARVREVCALYDVEYTDIGAFQASGRLAVCYAGRTVLDLDNQFLHHGIPQRKLAADIPLQKNGCADDDCCRGAYSENLDYAGTLLELLAHPNIASKAGVVRIYDHEVQGGTVIKPLTGAQDDGPSDASVLHPLGTEGLHAIALSNGINAEYGKRDAYRMAQSVIDEAVRNVVAVGADPSRIALLDNFCWGDPKRPETMGSLLEAARACYETSLLYGAPFISGKDSLNNEYLDTDGQRHAIPPTLVISALGQLDDLTRAVTMDLKQPGDVLYLVGIFDPRLGASHFRLVSRPVEDYDGEVPPLDADTPKTYRALYAAIQQGLVRACHDLSEGGLATAAAEMSIGGRLGLEIDLPGMLPTCFLYGETNGCLLAEVAPEKQAAFETALGKVSHMRIGRVRSDDLFLARQDGRVLIDLPVAALVQAWTGEGGRL